MKCLVVGLTVAAMLVVSMLFPVIALGDAPTLPPQDGAKAALATWAPVVYEYPVRERHLVLRRGSQPTMTISTTRPA